jgi:hypothetical protein
VISIYGLVAGVADRTPATECQYDSPTAQSVQPAAKKHASASLLATANVLFGPGLSSAASVKRSHFRIGAICISGAIPPRAQTKSSMAADTKLSGTVAFYSIRLRIPW